MTILKENLPFLELTNVNTWNENSYNGSIIHLVIFDEKGSPQEYMKNYASAPFCPEKIYSHATNCASTVNQFSECKITMLYNSNECREYFKTIAHTVDIVSISRSANKDMAENNWGFLEEYNFPIFASSGNDGDEELNYPSAFDWVISVGAWSDGIIKKYSNYSNKLDCVGITDVNILNSKGVSFTFGGTSCSCPETASVMSHFAHFIKANYNRKLERKETFEFIHNNCVDTKEIEKDGYGLLVLPSVPVVEKETIPEPIKEPVPIPEQPKKEETPLPTTETKKLYRVQTLPSAKLSEVESQKEIIEALGFKVYSTFANQVSANSVEDYAKANSDKLTKAGIANIILYY